jgi:hypothetical protein
MNVNIYLAPSLSLAPFYWENIIPQRLTFKIKGARAGRTLCTR